MISSDFYEALILFNEKVDKLSSLSFIEQAQKGTNATINWKESPDGEGEVYTTRTGPTSEAIDAFVLTFRFFIQKNEICSLFRMSQHYEKYCESDDLKDQFLKIRDKINEFLDSGPQVGIVFNKERLTFRTIMNTIIYGGLSHATKEKKELLDDLKKYPVYSIVENHLVSVLMVVYQYVCIIKKVNKSVLEEYTEA